MTAYGIVGAGMMGQEHIRYISMLPDATVAAVADPDPEMRRASADLAGAETRAYENPAALLSDGGVDALVIASPNHTHRQVIESVAVSGLPLLVEKPVCTTADDCAWIRGFARDYAAPVWVAMEYRYMPPISRLLEIVRGGEIGTLRMLTIREHRYPFLRKVGDWNRFNRNTGGTLVEKCCHFFDLMRLIIGREPIRIYASGAADVNHQDELYDGATPDILDNAYVVVDFDGGVRACLELCMFADGAYHQEHITAVGDAGRVEALIPGPERFWRGEVHRQAEIVVSPREPKGPRREAIAVDPELLAAGDHHGSTWYQHLGFLETVRSGKAVDVSVEDGVRAVVMGLAAEESAVTARVVSLDEATTGLSG